MVTTLMDCRPVIPASSLLIKPCQATECPVTGEKVVRPSLFASAQSKGGYVAQLSQGDTGASLFGPLRNIPPC